MPFVGWASCATCFALCTECNRRVRRVEATCPFCGGALVGTPRVSNSAGSSRAALVAAVTAAAGAIGACSAPVGDCEPLCRPNGTGAVGGTDGAVPSTGGHNPGSEDVTSPTALVLELDTRGPGQSRSFAFGACGEVLVRLVSRRGSAQWPSLAATRNLADFGCFFVEIWIGRIEPIANSVRLQRHLA